MPDIAVVFGVGSGPRGCCKLRGEGRPPDFVVEVSGRAAHCDDRPRQRELYAALGVREYFLIDPVYEDPGHEGNLQGCLLSRRGSVEVGPGGLARSGGLRSEVLGLRPRTEGRRVRIRDAVTGVCLPRTCEEREQLIRQFD